MAPGAAGGTEEEAEEAMEKEINEMRVQFKDSACRV
jgi:hypothetical protein